MLRMPVDASRRMMAVSRRSSNDVPAQAASRRSSSSARSTGGGWSGTAGGRTRAIGDSRISSPPPASGRPAGGTDRLSTKSWAVSSVAEQGTLSQPTLTAVL